MKVLSPRGKSARITAALILFFFVFQIPAFAQANTQGAASDDEADPVDKNEPVPYSKEEFPQWARDLRRAEIIAFGSLPFTLFFTKLSIDTVRYAQNDWDRRYAPWPLKTTGAVEMNEEQRIAALVTAGVASVVVALVDHIFVRIRRRAAERAAEARIPPAIITEREGWPPEVELPSERAAPMEDPSPVENDAQGEISPSPAEGER